MSDDNEPIPIHEISYSLPIQEKARAEVQTDFFESEVELTPERRLIAAMLINTIREARGEDIRGQTYRGVRMKYKNGYKSRAITWLRGVYEEPYPPYSFLWCLQVFHDDPDNAQDKLLSILEKLGPRANAYEQLTHELVSNLFNAKKL